VPQRRDVILFEVFLGILILVFIGASFYYSPKARLVPLVVGFFSLGLILYQLIVDVVTRGRKNATEETFLKTKFLQAASFAIGCSTLMILFGYFGCMAAVLVGLTRYWFKESWLLSLAVTVCLLFFSYILFIMIFAIDLYPGVIPSLVISFFPE
jgi:hypothetical protein